MVRWSSIGLITLGVIHLIVLGVDVPSEAMRWIEPNLWTFEHWQPVRSQPVDLALSNGIFWGTVGSFAVPTILLAIVIYRADRAGWQVPPFIGWSLFTWTVVASLIMAPSGFPVIAMLALCLAVGLQRDARG
ncbi:hypothetical protein GA830_18000 [Mesorhizobium sp. NBSH29]|uniref:hypothetical protein n=1 Tax=Mesorhizobium sp. NBSH29 TaxID=2654249 RepID=UPI001896948F|nr:hypothetical protein [Mesorhizobium sp. NBSH29]QPC88436.1 hypothetical protein GA830_18000 [Mesorhizobium sp. NBSH29]